MHLYRKHLVRIQKLEQQRKAAEARKELAHQLFPELLHHLAKHLPFERSVRNQALVVCTVAQHPRFSNRTVTRQWHGEQAGQSPAAPQAVLIDWIEAQGIQRSLGHGASSNSHDCELALDRLS